MTTGTRSGKIQWQWDFGDGQKSTAAKADHVYLLDGEYTVALTAKTGLGVLKRINRVHVSRPWDRVTTNQLDPIREYARIAAAYDFAALRPGAILQAVSIFERVGDLESIAGAGRAFVLREQAPPKVTKMVVSAYAGSLISLGRTKEAADGLLKGLELTRNAAVRASLMVQAGRIYLDRLADPDRALTLFERTVKQYDTLTSSPDLRLARIGIGDVWLIRGDYKRAKEAYSQAKVRHNVRSGQHAIVKGDFARQAEDAIRQRHFASARKTLDLWEETFPLHKLEGYATLLRVRLLSAQSQYEMAAGRAENLVRVNPASSYAAELLLLAAEAYTKLKQPDKAKDALKRILEKYPESSVTLLAKKRLK